MTPIMVDMDTDYVADLLAWVEDSARTPIPARMRAEIEALPCDASIGYDPSRPALFYAYGKGGDFVTDQLGPVLEPHEFMTRRYAAVALMPNDLDADTAARWATIALLVHVTTWREINA